MHVSPADLSPLPQAEAPRDCPLCPRLVAFREANRGRLILFSTKGEASPYEFAFQPDDILLFGKESGGVPPEVAAAADAVLRIPIRAEVRSFNLATSTALALGEALRQTGGLPIGPSV